MALKITLNDIIVEDVTQKDFDTNFRNNMEAVQKYINDHEDDMLDEIGGVASLIEDFEFVKDEDIESVSTKKADTLSLKAKIRDLETKLMKCGSCEHGVEYKTRQCVFCFGDGSETISICSKCEAGTFHRNGKCLQCEPNPPKPFSKLKDDMKTLLAHLQDPSIKISHIVKLYSAT
jgi:hypothetical protein